MKWSLVGSLSSKEQRKQYQYKLPSHFKWQFLSFLLKRGIKKGAEIMEAAVKINHCPADKFASLTATSRAAMIQPRRRIIIRRMNMVIRMAVVVMWRGGRTIYACWLLLILFEQFIRQKYSTRLGSMWLWQCLKTLPNPWLRTKSHMMTLRKVSWQKETTPGHWQH